MKVFLKLTATLIMITLIQSCDTSTFGPSDEIGTTLGFSGEDYAYSIEPTSDNGYFIVGYTNSIRNNYDLYAIKTDKKFNIQWSKTFGNNNIDIGYQGKETTDGGFVILGTVSIESGNKDILCIKLDRRGKMLWSQHFGGAKNESGRSLAELSDGGLVIAGTTESYGSGLNDIFIIKVDEQGHLKWFKTYGGEYNELVYDIKNTSDGGFVIIGRTGSYGASVYETFLLKIDRDGNQQWFITSGGSQDECQSVEQTADGGFIGVGRVYVGLGYYQNFIIKVDESSNVNTLTFGFSAYEESYSITNARDGNYIVVGETWLNNTAGDFQVLIYKIDPSGAVLWAKSYGGLNDDIGYCIRPADKGYTITGYTNSYGQGNADIYVLNIDEDGELQ